MICMSNHEMNAFNLVCFICSINEPLFDDEITGEAIPVFNLFLTQ
jgi:hypothetical protein